MSRHHRDRESPDKLTVTVTDFKEKMRKKARETEGYYVIMEILRKVKFKHQGKVSFEKPAFTLLVNVVESNLPMPANVYNPVFKFKRGTNIVKLKPDGTIEAADEKDDYVGTPTPEEYFTLPDYNNAINSDEPVKNEDGTVKLGEHYIHSTFVKIFDKPEEADAFILALVSEVERFVADISSFVEQNDKLFEWERFTMNGISDEGQNEITILKGGKANRGTVISFTEGRSFNVQAKE